MATEAGKLVAKSDADSISQRESPASEESQYAFASRLKELVREYSYSLEDSDELRQIQDVASELLYSRPSSIKILSGATSRWATLLRLLRLFLFVFSTSSLSLLYFVSSQKSQHAWSSHFYFFYYVFFIPVFLLFRHSRTRHGLFEENNAGPANEQRSFSQAASVQSQPHAGHPSKLPLATAQLTWKCVSTLSGLWKSCP